MFLVMLFEDIPQLAVQSIYIREVGFGEGETLAVTVVSLTLSIISILIGACSICCACERLDPDVDRGTHIWTFVFP